LFFFIIYSIKKTDKIISETDFKRHFIILDVKKKKKYNFLLS